VNDVIADTVAEFIRFAGETKSAAEAFQKLKDFLDYHEIRNLESE